MWSVNKSNAAVYNNQETDGASWGAAHELSVEMRLNDRKQTNANFFPFFSTTTPPTPTPHPRGSQMSPPARAAMEADVFT